MKTTLKIGMAVITMGILAQLLFGGGNDSTADIPALIKNGALVIDVRSPGEFSGGHIEKAINIPLNIISRDIQNHVPAKDQTIILYCHSGGRSASAKKTLEAKGYTHVTNAGGLQDMRKFYSK
jgi:phage shock protein E